MRGHSLPTPPSAQVAAPGGVEVGAEVREAVAVEQPAARPVRLRSGRMP